jgi:hypothetical protein
MGYKYQSPVESREANNRQKRERYWRDTEYRELQKLKARQRTKPYTLNTSDLRRTKRTGITLENLAALLEIQSYCCAICGDSEKIVFEKTKKRLAIDHNHKTKEVRGMLCGPCNRALGLFRDSPEILQAAIKYLGKGKGEKIE